MVSERKVIKFIEDNKLLNGVTKIYVAASGGADSMALLAFMKKNTDKIIVAVHVNHGIRNETADRDQKFVEHYCEKNNIDCIVFNAKIDGTVIPEKPSEEWARNLRYDYFDSLDMSHAVIATAHTASDQAETILFRLARGCGLKGLSGIPMKRNNIIRPFLCLTREETEELVEYYNTNNITDETNLTDDYSRNKIRHNVIPVLKDINQHAVSNITKAANKASEALDFIQSFAMKQLNEAKMKKGEWYNTDIVAKNHKVIIENMLMIILSNYEYSEGLLTDAADAIINGNYCEDEVKLFDSEIDKTHRLVITNKTISIKSQVEVTRVDIGPNDFGTFGHGVLIEKKTYDEFVLETKDKRELAFYLNGDIYPLSTLHMTSRGQGDKFKPACRYKTKVINHMTNLSLSEKDNVPLLKDKNGNIIYLHNVGFTDNMIPDKNTQSIYKFSSY